MSYSPYTGPGDENNKSSKAIVSSESFFTPERKYLFGCLGPPVMLLLCLVAVFLLVPNSDFPIKHGNTNLSPSVATSGLPTVAVPLPAAKVGSPAPDFELVDLSTGQPVTLSSLKGKPVWINFWATWCPPCKEEMPIMEKHYQENKDNGLVILGVDVQEKESDVSPYIKEGGYTWTFVIDTTGKIADTYHVSGLPSHYFIDKDGLIQAIVIGGLKSEMTGEIRDVAPYLQKIMP